MLDKTTQSWFGGICLIGWLPPSINLISLVSLVRRNKFFGAYHLPCLFLASSLTQYELVEESSWQAEIFRHYCKRPKIEQAYLSSWVAQGSATENRSPQYIHSHVYQVFIRWSLSFVSGWHWTTGIWCCETLRTHWFAVELQNSWQSLSAEWQLLCGGTALLAA